MLFVLFWYIILLFICKRNNEAKLLLSNSYVIPGYRNILCNDFSHIFCNCGNIIDILKFWLLYVYNINIFCVMHLFNKNCQTYRNK